MKWHYFLLEPQTHLPPKYRKYRPVVRKCLMRCLMRSYAGLIQPEFSPSLLPPCLLLIFPLAQKSYAGTLCL